MITDEVYERILEQVRRLPAERVVLVKLFSGRG